MKSVSRIALAAALVAGLNGAAFAQRDQPGNAPPAISTPVRTALAAAQAALAARDYATAEPHVTALEAAAATDLERYFAQTLRLSLESGRSQAQPEAQRAVRLVPLLDAVIANPATPAAEVAQRYNERGNLLYANKKWVDAQQSFLRARDGGYSDGDLLANIARVRIASGDVVGGIADLDVAVKADQAAGRKVPEDVYRYAIARLTTIKATAQAEDWTRRWLTDYGTAANWRAAVYTFGLTGPGAATYAKNRLDLYRLLYATKALAGQKDYTDYADAAIAAGLPEEARTVAKEGVDSGAIMAGGVTVAALTKTIAAKSKGSASPEAREKRARAGSSAELARQAGDAYFATRKFDKAAELYRLAGARSGGDADLTNLHLGMALALAGDRAGAQAALGLVAGEPQRDVARLWGMYLAVGVGAAG